MEIKTQFSFLKLFNTIKGVTKPCKPGESDSEWLNDPKVKKTKQKFDIFLKWCDDCGIQRPKIKYPVLFGSGENRFPGCMATEDIGRDEVFIKVPSRIIISTQRAMLCEPLQQMFYDHPQTFGKHVSLGEDNVLDAYILYQFTLGEQSIHYQMFQTWPDEPDILMNWEEEDLEYLQDPTLIEDAEKGQDEFFTQWEQLYSVLRQYPHLFTEADISMNKFKYVYIVTTNRAFSSNWPGVSLMVPFADFMNHENVDTCFDCVDENGKSIGIEKEEEKKNQSEIEKERQVSQRKRDFLNNMKTDLLELETQIRSKMEEEGHQTQTEEAKQDQEVSLKLMQMTMKNLEAQREEQKQEEEEKKETSHVIETGYISSGLESDNDLDLLVEQEALRSQRMRPKPRKFAEMGEVGGGSTGKEQIEMTKDMAKAVWDQVIDNMPDDYEFQMKTCQDAFPKGSQVYLCYGRMTNREMLKRYGFCIINNKYNNMFIKLRLEVTDPDFKYRLFILQKFFSLDPDTKRGGVNVSSRHFKVHYHHFNMKVLKFIKILSFNVKEDDISCIVETRSLSLEYISLQKLQKVYQDFLDQFPTTLQQDMAHLRDPAKLKTLSVRQHAAYIYRTEQKRILINQITLIKILLHMIERLMRGMTLDFAVTRVFELETKKEFPVNRLMIDNYLSSLKRGMKKNEEDYYKMRGMDPESGKRLMQETQKKMMQDMSRVAYRQFEVKGYEKMIERIMEQPLQSSAANNNVALQEKLLLIQEQLKRQQEKNAKIEREAEKYVTENVFQQELQEAIARRGQSFASYMSQGLQAQQRNVANQPAGSNPEESKDAEADDEGESSYYDTEEEGESEQEDATAASSESKPADAGSNTTSGATTSTVYQGHGDHSYEVEQMKLADQLKPKKDQVIDLSGNYQADKTQEVEAHKIVAAAKKREVENLEKSELFQKMKAEWQALQQDPSSVDNEIRNQLEMLEQINKSAFEVDNSITKDQQSTAQSDNREQGKQPLAAAAEDGVESTEQQPSQINKVMQQVMREQRIKAEGAAVVTAEYRSRGEPFQDL